jgi:hypothetical protein
MKTVDSRSRFRERWLLGRALAVMADIPAPKRALVLDVLTKSGAIPASCNKEEPRNITITISNSTVNILCAHQVQEPEEGS